MRSILVHGCPDAAAVCRGAMTFSPPVPEEEKPREEQETDYGVDTTQATPSWRDEDQWEARPADDDSRWRNSSTPTATDPSKWGSAKTREEAAALQTCEVNLTRALKKERPRTLLGAALGGQQAPRSREPHILGGAHPRHPPTSMPEQPLTSSIFDSGGTKHPRSLPGVLPPRCPLNPTQAPPNPSILLLQQLCSACLVVALAHALSHARLG
jgi:hypothetical protein